MLPDWARGKVWNPRSPPPFVGFFAPKILRTAAEGLGFFPFNPCQGLPGLSKLGSLGAEQEGIQNSICSANYLCCVRECKHKVQALFGPPGAIFEKNTTCKTKKKSFDF